MSARPTSSSVQGCLQGAVVALLDRIGTATAACELGIDASTIRRHRASGDWSLAEVAALIAFEVQEHGRSTIADSLDQHLNADALRGEAIRLRGDLMREITDDGRLCAAAAQAHDAPTREALQNLEDLIDARTNHAAQLRASIEAAKARNP